MQQHIPVLSVPWSHAAAGVVQFCRVLQCCIVSCIVVSISPISFFSASLRVRGKGRGFKNAETMEVMETEDGRGHTSDDELSTQ